jgi:hypothetical protein
MLRFEQRFRVLIHVIGVSHEAIARIVIFSLQEGYRLLADHNARRHGVAGC